MLGIFRLPNLFIVALTQFLLQYLVLLPALNEASLSPSLNLFHFTLLVFTTVLIAAGGYVINDIIDYEIDLINKPEKVFIGKVISAPAAILLYGIITMTGTAIALYLADYVNNYWLFFIYPTAVVLLFFYSLFLKKIPLAGNIVVSIFCAGVAGIVLFSERQAFINIMGNQPRLGQKVSFIFSGYIIFAFISTLLREIIKDVEDMEGDRKIGLKTYPIIFGQKSTQYLLLIISVVLLIGISLAAYWLFLKHEWMGVIFAISFLLVPLIYIIYFIKKSTSKKDFSILSKWTKLVMLAGLLLLIVLWKS